MFSNILRLITACETSSKMVCPEVNILIALKTLTAVLIINDQDWHRSIEQASQVVNRKQQQRHQQICMIWDLYILTQTYEF